MISRGIFSGLLLIVVLVGLSIVLRRRSYAAIALYVLQFSLIGVAAGGNRWILLSAVFITAIWTAVTVRVGLFAIVIAQTIFSVAFSLLTGINVTSWFLPSAMAPILFIVLLTAFAFRTALGGQAMFSAKLLDE
jgi:hypothetical protein